MSIEFMYTMYVYALVYVCLCAYVCLRMRHVLCVCVCVWSRDNVKCDTGLLPCLRHCLFAVFMLHICQTSWCVSSQEFSCLFFLSLCSNSGTVGARATCPAIVWVLGI